MCTEFLRTIFRNLVSLNFYTPTSTDLHTVQTGRWATRFYVILLVSSVIILTFYSSLVYNTETTIISQPSSNTFLALQTNAKQGLSCPCKQIAIQQSSLVSFSPKFHQVCSSDFLSDYWFNYLAFLQPLGFISYNNWRYGVLPKFKFLQAGCDLANNTVTDAGSTFDQQRFITSVALSPVVYNSQMDVLIQSMINDAYASFSRTLDLILFNKRYEQLLNLYGSSAYLATYNGYITTYSIIYNSTCDCGTTFTCTEQIVLDINNVTVPMPGWYIGCYMIDSLLASTLESYYNKLYIDFIYESQPTIDYWNGYQWNTSTPHPQPLDISRAVTSRFPPNTTVRNILNSLFVEDWGAKFDFESYYQHCEPTQCSYTQNVRKNLITVITTILGLLGGLSTALNIIIFNLVRFTRGPAKEFHRYLRERITQRRAQVSPVAIISH